MRTIYTDGSCLGNPWPWWWAVILKHEEWKMNNEQWGNRGEQEIILSWGENQTTNNVMELTAAIQALQWLWETYAGKVWEWTEAEIQDWFFASVQENPSILSTDPVLITTDSSYVKLGITEWMVTRKRRQRRRAKGGKLVENVALWKQLDKLTQYFPNLMRARTRAHVGTELNERVDQLAREQASKYL